MAQEFDRREHNRVQMDLVTQVAAQSADGVAFIEKTVLRNISGGGASFITRQADRYFPKQQLEIQIELPGTVDLKAYLRGTATVVRVEPLPDSEPPQTVRRHAVAVMITVPLQLIRKNTGKIQKPAGK